MGCNCKKVPLKNNNLKSDKMLYNKKGIKYVLNIFKEKMWIFLGKIVTILLIIITIPILSCILIFNLFTKGKMVIKLPFIENKIQENMTN